MSAIMPSGGPAAGWRPPGVPRGLRLADGRRLAWYEFGLGSGAPLFYFHGFPGTGVEAAWGHTQALAARLRLIAVDRPGFGGSSRKPGRSIGDFSQDVVRLADHLGCDRFLVLGMSGGAPYALASAALLEKRVRAAVVVSGLGPLSVPGSATGMMPLNRLGLRLAGRHPGTLYPLVPAVGWLVRRWPQGLVRRLAAAACLRDRAVLLESGLGRVLAESFRRSVQPGSRGMLEEATLFGRPWGEWLGDIGIPVYLHHGERDRVVPLSMAHGLTGRIPTCQATYYPEGGHFSVVADHLADILGPVRNVAP